MKRSKERKPQTHYGDGSYSQSKDGTWVYAVMIGKDANGKPRRRFIRSKSLEKLKQKVSDAKIRGGGEIMSRRAETAPDRTEKPTVRAFVDTWLADVVKPKADSTGATTHETYSIMWRKHARPLVDDDVLLADYAARDVVQLYASLRKAKKSPSVIEKTATMFSAAFSYAVKIGEYAGLNPFRMVPRPTYEARERRSLTEEEARRFVKAAKGDRYELLWLLLLGTGARLGEMLALRWSDLDTKQRTLAIRNAVKEGTGPARIGRTKTGGTRQVRLPAIVIDALKNYRKELRAGAGFIFTTDSGGHPRRSNLRSRYFAPICKAAGIEGLTIHGLRHTAATLALAAGAPAKAVASRLGHSSTRVLTKHYEHLVAGGDEAIVNLLDVALRPRRSVR